VHRTRFPHGFVNGQFCDCAQKKSSSQVFIRCAILFTPGAASVVVPLPVREGDVPMTISVGGPTSRINRASIPKVLRHIHAALDAMGPPGAPPPSDEQVWQD